MPCEILTYSIIHKQGEIKSAFYTFVSFGERQTIKASEKYLKKNKLGEHVRVGNNNQKCMESLWTTQFVEHSVCCWSDK